MRSSSSWQTAHERFHRHVHQDTRLARRLNNLSEIQASEIKLAEAVEAGRVYGMRAQKYQMTLQKELDQQLQRAPVEKAW